MSGLAIIDAKKPRTQFACRGSRLQVLSYQEVDIYFNFIGNFVPPKQEPDAPILTAEQQEVERKKEVRRDREREQNRLRMQRVRAAQKAALQAETWQRACLSSQVVCRI